MIDNTEFENADNRYDQSAQRRRKNLFESSVVSATAIDVFNCSIEAPDLRQSLFPSHAITYRTTGKGGEETLTLERHCTETRTRGYFENRMGNNTMKLFSLYASS